MGATTPFRGLICYINNDTGDYHEMTKAHKYVFMCPILIHASSHHKYYTAIGHGFTQIYKDK